VSGPKAWMFTSQGQALLRSFAAAFASIEALEQQWIALQNRVREAEADFGANEIRVSVVRPAALPDARKVTLEQANGHLLALRRAVERLETELAQEVQRHQRARESAAAQAAVRDRAGGIVADLMADMVRATPEPTVHDATGVPDASRPRVVEGGRPRREPRAEGTEETTTPPSVPSDLERVLGRLAAEVPALQRAEIYALAERRADDPFAIEARLADVRRRVQESNQAARRWPEEEEALHLLLLQVRAFNGPASDEWENLLQAALDERTPLAPNRRAAVEAFVLAEAAAEERRHVQRAVEEALGGLGYEVGDRFETLFVEGGSVFVQRPSWGEYYVRWRVDGEGGEANTNVVRLPGATDGSSVDRARRDREIEEAWCDDAARLGEALIERGVQARLTRATPAGSLPVPVLKQSPASMAAAGVQRARHAASRKREA
jgi:hypothetical protein